MFFCKIHAEVDMILGMFGTGPFHVACFLYHPGIMHEGAGKAKEDFLHAETFAAELSAMEQSRHGQVGIGYVPEIMIIGVAGFVSLHMTFIQVNGEFENTVNRFCVKLWSKQAESMEYLFMNRLRGIHIDKCRELLLIKSSHMRWPGGIST